MFKDFFLKKKWFHLCFCGSTVLLMLTLPVLASDPLHQKVSNPENKGESSKSKPHLNFVPSNTSSQSVLAEEELLTQFDIKIERIPDSKLTSSGYARGKESLKFNVTVTPHNPLSQWVQLEIQLVALVQNDWNSEILGKMVSNTQQEEYKQSFQITFEKNSTQSFSKHLDLGAFYSNADYFFPGGRHFFKKHFLQAEGRITILKVGGSEEKKPQ